MFRYLALVWDDDAPASRTAARHLARHLDGDSAWQTALRTDGLSVFVTGARVSGNGVYTLPSERGVVLGRLFRRGADEKALVRHGPLEPEDAEGVLQRGSPALVTDWWGRYVAFLKAADGTTTVLRDPTGTLPCFTLEHEGVQIVFSWLEDLVALPGVSLPPIAWERLPAHLQFGELGNQLTLLEGVERLLPGEALHVGRAGRQTGLVWNALSFAGSPLDDDPAQLAPLVHETVRYCGRSWAEGQHRILLRLSGGLDSSILACSLAGGGTPADILCVNYHSPGADTDERRYARLAARHAGLELIECERDDAYRLERVLDVALTPSPATYVGRMAAAARDADLSQRHQAHSLFTGAGGDQLFFELRTWWPAADFLSLRGAGRGLAHAMLDAARLARLSVWQTASLALRVRMGRAAGTDALSWPLALVAGDALEAAAAARYTHPLLRTATGLPIGKLNHLRMLLHPIGYYDPYERERAPDVVNPLLSQPLIELCLRLPTYRLTQGGRGRALVRQAFASDLPPEIAARRSKGSIEDHLRTVLARNLRWVREMLLDGELVARGLLDRQKVEAALSDRPQAATVHVTEIHGHIAVEAWLRRWRGIANRHAA